MIKVKCFQMMCFNCWWYECFIYLFILNYKYLNVICRIIRWAKPINKAKLFEIEHPCKKPSIKYFCKCWSETKYNKWEKDNKKIKSIDIEWISKYYSVFQKVNVKGVFYLRAFTFLNMLNIVKKWWTFKKKNTLSQYHRMYRRDCLTMENKTVSKNK